MNLAARLQRLEKQANTDGDDFCVCDGNRRTASVSRFDHQEDAYQEKVRDAREAVCPKCGKTTNAMVICIEPEGSTDGPGEKLCTFKIACQSWNR
jgi:hypothetical protein